MSTIMRGVFAAGRDVRDYWVQGCVAAMIIALLIGLPLRFLLPDDEMWLVWHSVEAYYGEYRQPPAVVISSRSWSLNEQCPADEIRVREARIVGTDKIIRTFDITAASPTSDELHGHSDGPIVVPLVSGDGQVLDFMPATVQLVARCGNWPPSESRVVDLAEPQEWWRQ